MAHYEEIVFIEHEEAAEPLAILEEQGEEAAMNYLRQWDYGDHDGEIFDENPAGSGDHVYWKDGYVMSYNTYFQYIGLCKIINDDVLAS